MIKNAINKRTQTYIEEVGIDFHLDRGDKTCTAELVWQK